MGDEDMMNGKEFEQHLLRHGAGLADWPGDLRARAVEALTASPELRALLDEHGRLEDLLRSRPHEAPAPDFEDRIIAAARGMEQHGSAGPRTLMGRLAFEFRVPAPVLATVLVLLTLAGFALGLAWSGDAASTDMLTPSGELAALADSLHYEGELL